MAVALVAEILRDYKGPHHRKLWLLAWAEHASADTRSGWCPRRHIAEQLGVSQSRASHIASELVAEGVLKRDGTANSRHVQRFILGDLNGTRKGAADSTLSPMQKGAHRSTQKGAAPRTRAKNKA